MVRKLSLGSHHQDARPHYTALTHYKLSTQCRIDNLFHFSTPGVVRGLNDGLHITHPFATVLHFHGLLEDDLATGSIPQPPTVARDNARRV